jgi:methyl-accepting chemotaxis protein
MDAATVPVPAVDDPSSRLPGRRGSPSERVSRVGGQHELTDDLDGMAAALDEVDSRAAERLTDLSRAIGSEEGRAQWSDVDLSRAFNSERLAHSYAVRREGGYSPASIEIATRVRDVLVLLPLLLTWLAFYEASQAYENFIENNPEQVRSPFLLLWQRGFGGEGSLLANSFSTVALIDVILIALIILLTFYSQGKRDQREDNIARTAGVFQSDLDNVLGAATVALASEKSNRPAVLARSVERLAERFDHSTQELLARLRLEHDRLETIANRREKEFSDFGVFASGMRAGAEVTHRLLLDLRQVSTSLTESLEDLTSEVSVTGDQQRGLLNAVTNLERLTDSSVKSDHALTRRLTEAAESLADSSDRALAGADAAAQAGRVAAEAVRGIAELTDSLGRSQSRVEEAIADGTETNSRLADALRSSAGGVNDSTRQLNQIGAGLAQLQLEFSRIGEQSETQTRRLTDLLEEQHDVAGGISQVARDLSAVGIATAQRQREVSDELSGLLRRLDELTATLTRVAPRASSPPAQQDPSSAWPSRPPAPEQPQADERAGERQSLWPRGQRRPTR